MKYIDGSKTFTVRFPQDIYDRLREMDKPSEFIVQVIKEALAAYEAGILRIQIAMLDQDMADLELATCELRLKKALAEAALNRSKLRRENSIEARQRALKTLKSIPREKHKAWLGSRTDVMTECDFKDPQEAIDWFRANSKNQVR